MKISVALLVAAAAAAAVMAPPAAGRYAGRYIGPAQPAQVAEEDLKDVMAKVSNDAC